MEARYVKSVFNAGDLPKDHLLEIAIAGKSNVGKSSLLNRLTGQKHLAKTSGTPGKTRCLNFFHIQPDTGSAFYLVDLPGYGYAQVSKSMRKEWADLMDKYMTLEDRPSALISLFDIRRDVSDYEIEWIDWLGTWGRPFLIVLTKSDKLSGNERTRALRNWTKASASVSFEPVLFSSVNGTGKDELWKWIMSVRQDKKTRVGR